VPLTFAHLERSVHNLIYTGPVVFYPQTVALSRGSPIDTCLISRSLPLSFSQRHSPHRCLFRPGKTGGAPFYSFSPFGGFPSNWTLDFDSPCCSRTFTLTQVHTSIQPSLLPYSLWVSKTIFSSIPIFALLCFSQDLSPSFLPVTDIARFLSLNYFVHSR